MDLKEIHLIDEVEDIRKNWYYTEKSKACMEYLPLESAQTLIDIGSGSGFIAREFALNNIVKNVFCVDINYAEDRVEKLKKGSAVKYTNSIQDEDVSADIALFNDVIEHVEDDVALLKEYLPKIKSGGYVLITVPAFNFMWSAHDDYVVHYRRYNKKSLEKAVEDAGLEVVKTNYFYATLFPLVFVMRKLDNLKRKFIKTPIKSAMKQPNPFVNAVLQKIHAFERKLVFKRNKAYGLTVFCLARKK
jgi:2-polyprenyl-3-methyl-5-hydroxy-6-metoxy-1,4-benzoquinol methylase